MRCLQSEYSRARDCSTFSDYWSVSPASTLLWLWIRLDQEPGAALTAGAQCVGRMEYFAPVDELLVAIGLGGRFEDGEQLGALLAQHSALDAGRWTLQAARHLATAMDRARGTGPGSRAEAVCAVMRVADCARHVLGGLVDGLVRGALPCPEWPEDPGQRTAPAWNQAVDWCPAHGRRPALGCAACGRPWSIVERVFDPPKLRLVRPEF
jgi:hypothetical protein